MSTNDNNLRPGVEKNFLILAGGIRITSSPSIRDNDQIQTQFTYKLTYSPPQL